MRRFALIAVATAAPLLFGQAPPVPQKPKPITESGTYTFTAGPYTYDALGNIVAISTDTYTYDADSRLRTATIKSPDGNTTATRNYDYDLFGNLTSKSGDLPNVTIGVDLETNHLNAAGTTYDALGDITTLHPPGSASTYHFTYDALGMLQSTLLDAGTTEDYYVYTADDERLWTYDIAHGSNNTLLFEKSSFAIRDLSGNVLRRFEQQPSTSAWTGARSYYYRDGALLASSMDSTATVEHFTLDHLGTPRLITNASANKIGFHVYFSFGEEWFPAENVVQEAESRKFTGHERDRDIAADLSPLDYMHARYYTANSARFLSTDATSPDLESPQGWNRYPYVNNSPMIFTDPTGLDSQPVQGTDCGGPGQPRCGIYVIGQRPPPVPPSHLFLGPDEWKITLELKNVSFLRPDDFLHPEQNKQDPVGRCIEQNSFSNVYRAAGHTANAALNIAVGSTGRVGVGGVLPHATTWQHTLASGFGANASRVGRAVGRGAIVLTVFEGFYDIGTIGRCGALAASR